MSNPIRFVVVGGVVFTALALCGARAESPPPFPLRQPVIELSHSEREAIEAFEERLEAYLALHRKLELTLPKLPKRATPQQVDANQRAFGALVKTARADAKQGEFFTPVMQTVVKRTMEAVLSGPDGNTMKASIMDENPGVPQLGVNDRYPDSIPLSTMPPQVLKALPKLEEDLEYRFIGERLVLMDSHAHNIIDFTDDVLP